MDYSAYYRKATSEGYQAYYDVVAQAGGIDPQATARTRNAVDAVPGEAKDKLFNVAAEIKNTFHEFGAPLPPLLEGCTVVDLCCGSGRDTYLAAQLVGPGGRVIGVESNEARLGIARKYLDKEMKQFGFAEANVELVHGVPEDLSFIPDDTVDVVISNCTFNLSPDKAAYIAEVKRVLKPQGEWYFTDVFTDVYKRQRLSRAWLPWRCRWYSRSCSRICARRSSFVWSVLPSASVWCSSCRMAPSRGRCSASSPF